MSEKYSIGSDEWPGFSKLIEEMGELQQVIGKFIATGGKSKHWDGSNLRERFVEEAADVKAAIEFVTIKNLTNDEFDQFIIRAKEKLLLFQKWHRQ